MSEKRRKRHSPDQIISKLREADAWLNAGESVGGRVAEALFEQGLCLPSGSNLVEDDLRRVVAVVREVAGT